MAGELKSGALLNPEAMVPASPDLAAEEDPASRQEGEYFSPRRRTVSTAAGGRLRGELCQPAPTRDILTQSGV